MILRRNASSKRDDNVGALAPPISDLTAGNGAGYGLIIAPGRSPAPPISVPSKASGAGYSLRMPPGAAWRITAGLCPCGCAPEDPLTSPTGSEGCG